MHTEHIQAPNVIARFANRPPNNGDPTNQRHELLEEAILALLRQHCPAYLKTDGRSIRTAFSRSFVRFVLERAHGNQARRRNRRVQPQHHPQACARLRDPMHAARLPLTQDSPMKAASHGKLLRNHPQQLLSRQGH